MVSIVHNVFVSEMLCSTVNTFGYLTHIFLIKVGYHCVEYVLFSYCRAAGNLLSPGNVNLLNEMSDEYAKYKSGQITKSQYDYRRKRAPDMFKANVGPFEKWMFGKNTTHESIRIA